MRKAKDLALNSTVGILDVCAYINRNFAGDMDDQRNIERDVVRIFGVLISFVSKSQTFVTLQIIELKQFSLDEAVQEVTFMVQLTNIWEWKSIKLPRII
jgi:hypothetical protein